MKKLLIVSPLVIVLVAIFLSRWAVTDREPLTGLASAAVVSVVSDVVSVAEPSSASETELLELQGLDAQWRQIETALAPIVSNSQERAAVIRFVTARVTALNKSQDAVMAQVAKRLGGAPPPGFVRRFDSATSAWVNTRS